MRRRSGGNSAATEETTVQTSGISAESSDGSVTFNGTGTLDLGDGTAPTGGLALTGTLTATGITVTIGGNAIPTLPKSDGWTTVE